MIFVLPFKNGNNDPTEDFLDKYYMPLVEIKDFNALIDKKLFFGWPVQKTNKKRMKDIYNYTTKILLDYLYRQKHYKLIGRDLSR